MNDRATFLGIDWTFLFSWLMATTVGWVMGGFLAAGVALLVTGAAIGVLQWIPLEKRLPQAGRWIIATWAGWALAQVELIMFNPGQNRFITGVVVGLLVGIAQWLLLRNHVRWAAWWVVMNVVAWTSGFALLPGFFTTGMVPGLITGMTLDLLLRSSNL